ncbi:MAG: Transporter, major facilitator family protein, partial [Elusimicrobia bacterium]
IFGLAPVLVFFLAALAIENVGIEAQNLGMPPLIAKVFGDVTISATMGMWASFADIVGSIITPPIIKRVGLKQTFLWSGGARLALAAATAGLLATSHITVPWLLALTALGAFVGGINYTSEKAIPAVLLDQNRAGLERFKAARQGVIEVIATLIPIAAGALVAQFGFLPAVFAFPVAGAVAMTLVAFTLKMPRRAAQALGALKGSAPLRAGAPAGMKDFWTSLTRGTRLLWSQPALRNSFLAYAAFSVLTHLFYWILAPAYGLLVAGPGHEEAAALIQGVMLGLLSLGGLVASVYLMREHKRFDRLDPSQRDGAMRRSLKRWMLLGTLVLAAMATMAVPTPAWGALTLPALALIPFGMAQVVAKLKLEALFQSASPPEALDDTTAAMEAWMSLAIMGGLWGVQWAFASATGYGPFAIIAWAMLPLAAIGLYLTHLLARTKKSA